MASGRSPLSDLGVDEAYRFDHSQSFCNFGQRITITRKADSIRMYYVEFGASDEKNTVEFYDLDGN